MCIIIVYQWASNIDENPKMSNGISKHRSGSFFVLLFRYTFPILHVQQWPTRSAKYVSTSQKYINYIKNIK